MTIRVLLAEDDANLRQGLIDLLEGEGYAVEAAADGRQALEAFRRQSPDLVLLDVMMPELSGYDVCRTIRKSDSRTPIIMLTAKGEEIDKVVGLELGADDYVTKPFGLHELRARIAAVLRRCRNGSPETAAGLPEQFAIGQALVDRKTYLVRLGSRTHSLTSRELKLLDIFHARPNEVLSRNDLLNAAWGVDYFGTTRTLDQHIAQLRKKIEPDPASPRYLLTVHGVGYKLAPAEPPCVGPSDGTIPP
jgi:DNA-binding response OmpR family regulator